MTLECLVSDPLRKQKFHQDYFDLRSLIIKYVDEKSIVSKLEKSLMNIYM